MKRLNRKALRQLVEHHDAIRAALLSDRQREIYQRIVNFGEITSPEFAEFEKVSIQSATTQLANLWRKGYLTRKDAGAPSGGSLYVYSDALGVSERWQDTVAALATGDEAEALNAQLR